MAPFIYESLGDLELESATYRVQYWPPSVVEVGGMPVPAFYGGYHSQQEAEEALKAALANGCEGPWVERLVGGEWRRMAACSSCYGSFALEHGRIPDHSISGQRCIGSGKAVEATDAS